MNFNHEELMLIMLYSSGTRLGLIHELRLNKYVKEAPFADPEQSPFMSEIHVLKDDPDFEL